MCVYALRVGSVCVMCVMCHVWRTGAMCYISSSSSIIYAIPCAYNAFINALIACVLQLVQMLLRVFTGCYLLYTVSVLSPHVEPVCGTVGDALQLPVDNTRVRNPKITASLCG